MDLATHCCIDYACGVLLRVHDEGNCMITHIFILVLCLNGSLYMVNLEGSPFATDIGNGSCLNHQFTEDDITNISPTGDGTTTTQLLNNMTNPESGGTIFDPITQTLERSADSIDTMVDMVTGGYILSFADKVVISCGLDTNPESETYNQIIPIENPVWDAFKLTFRAIIVVLTTLTLFYWLSGRGHILSS